MRAMPLMLKLKIIIRYEFIMTLEPVNSFAELLKEVLESHELSQKQISLATGVPEPHLSLMKLGKRRVTPEYDLRLTRFFGFTEGYLLRLQLSSDLYNARLEKGSQMKSVSSMGLSSACLPSCITLMTGFLLLMRSLRSFPRTPPWTTPPSGK